MDCRESEEKLEPYLLGALDSDELLKMDEHINTCSTCKAKMREEGDVVSHLAFAAPQLKAPPRIKQQLMARIDATRQAPVAGAPTARRTGMMDLFGRSLVAQSGFAAAAAVVLVIVFGGIWFDNRLNEIASEKEELEAKVESMAVTEAEMKRMVEQQRYLTYLAASPDASVMTLSASTKVTQTARKPSAMVVLHPTNTPVLVVLNMPVLPLDRVYQAWLVREGIRYSAGMIPVDSSGWGLTGLEFPDDRGGFDAIIITVERAGGSSGPTGERVLTGDL